MATQPSYLGTDVIIAGTLTVQTGFNPPAASIGDDAIEAAAGLSASKIEQQYNQTVALSAHGTSAATTRQVIHQAYGDGTVIAFGAGSTVIATGGDSATVELKKNGSTILTAPVVLDSGNTAFIIEAGTISSAAYVDTDVFEAEITAVSGTTVKGLYVRLIVREDAAP